MRLIERIVFFGTPEFALPTLEALVAAGRRPVLVVTQPPRPAGRGGLRREPPVADWARRHGFPVEQPPRVRDPAFLDRLAALAPEVAVVVAFGQIFPRRLLEIPTHGAINLHASLLPAWRGAAPIQAALAAGETRTGVTTQRIVEELDAGPILLQEEAAIDPGETAGELSARLAQIGARLVVETLRRLEQGTLEPREQRHEAATYAPRLTKEDGRVDWSSTAFEISNRLRAFTPWPGLTALLRGSPVKLLAGGPVEGEPARADSPGVDLASPGTHPRAPGTLVGLHAGDRLMVVCGGGTLLGIERLQRPGRKPLAAADFARGERLALGERFS